MAFLPFEFEEKDDSRIGQRIAELLAEAQALNPGVRVMGPQEVRARLDGAPPPTAQLLRGGAAGPLGARLEVDAVVTGQAYALAERFYLVARVVGCATGRVFGAGVEGSLTAPLPEIVEALAPGVDDLLIERRPELLLPGERARQAEEALAARVRALRRQKEPPPVIIVAADTEESSGTAATAARDRIAGRVRRAGLVARPQSAGDLLEWARSQGEGAAEGVPGPLRGQGMVLALVLRVEPLPATGSLAASRASGEARWLDARDGASLGSGAAVRDAVGASASEASAAAARRLAQSLLDDSFAAALARWEARHREDAAGPTTASNR